jgi:hypothetical protein
VDPKIYKRSTNALLFIMYFIRNMFRSVLWIKYIINIKVHLLVIHIFLDIINAWKMEYIKIHCGCLDWDLNPSLLLYIYIYVCVCVCVCVTTKFLRTVKTSNKERKYRNDRKNTGMQSILFPPSCVEHFACAYFLVVPGGFCCRKRKTLTAVS